MFIENASVILGHMNAEVVLSIVLKISRNTRYCFRISAELLISANNCVAMATVIGICGSNYHIDNGNE